MTLASPVATTVEAHARAVVDGLSGPVMEAVCDSAQVQALLLTQARPLVAAAEVQARAEAPGLPRPTVAVPQPL